MHWQAFTFVSIVKNIFPEYFVHSKVVEFGSAYVNATIRELFLAPKSYYGLDLAKTTGVDIVYDGRSIYISDNLDIAISCECFEHNPYYQATFENMVKHVRQGGLVLFTCATDGRPEHGTKRTSPEQSPGTQAAGFDYYKNLNAIDFDEDFITQNFSSSAFFVNRSSHDLYFVGIKNTLPDNDNHKECKNRLSQIGEYHITAEQLSFSLELLWKDNSEENCENFFGLLTSLPQNVLTPFNFQLTVERVFNGLPTSKLINLVHIINEKLILHSELYFLHKPLYLLHRKLDNKLLANFHAVKLFSHDAKDENLLYLFESLLNLGAKSQAECLFSENATLISNKTASWVFQNFEIKIKRARLSHLLSLMEV